MMDGGISNSTTEEKMNNSQRLTPQTTADLFDSVDAFLFDCDGVIWKGDALIDGVSDALDTLRALVGAVVVGLDQYINYYKLQYATLCIRENPGCLFIATNRDAVGHLTDLQEWPGAGCMVAAVCGSTQKEPIVVGKPSTFLMEFLLKKFNIPTSRMCMVGDRLDTDILFGQNAGCRTLLVLSGVTNISDLQDSNNHIQPEYFTDKVSDIITLLNNSV
ncbi:UNVERIFIED_CONTAM: Phosphoglycolate phosphatase 2 [Sesamum radiatum]|uniref:Phosphoglycolate phosphatase 2 n=1 Tax=Sesamum radiatum TaxID=300843 RepID=A0AAW2T2P3_SESRA